MQRLFSYDSKGYYLWLHIITFFYIYSVQFVGVPLNLSTRVIFSIFGFTLFFSEILNKGVAFSFDKKFLLIIFALIGMVFFSLVSMFFNKTADSEFIRYSISIILILFAGYFVIRQFSKKFDLNDISNITKLIINVVFIQMVLALLMFIFTPFKDFLNGIQVITDSDLGAFEWFAEYRLIGLGSKFFTAGIVNGIALILIASLIKFEKDSKTNVMKYSFMFLVIFILGMMMARTTIIGLMFAFVIFFFPQKTIDFRIIKRVLKFVVYMVLIPIVLLFCLFYFVPSIQESAEALSNYGFEMFVNYFDSGNLETKSTDELGEMYLWPTQIKTYLIGDGYFTDPFNQLYYMGTDVGILRLIYYFGVLGMITFFLVEFAAVRQAYSNYPKYKVLFLMLFLYCLFLNFKGFTDITFVLALFCYSGNSIIADEES